jgi:arylsulfatase A-like enzyme
MVLRSLAFAVLLATIFVHACASPTTLTVSDGGGARDTSSAERPNIVFIMSDDHAQSALSCYGSTLNETPHLDRLAREGLRFDRAFVTNSICSPSRASILTGKYSHVNGVPTFNRFDGSQPTVAKLLQAAGYHTGMIGKWHLGSEPTGFDTWTILPGQGAYVDPAFLTAQGRVETSGYVTEVITDLGLEFLRTRPAEKPFFLMLHHKAPHRNWTPDARNRALFEGRDFAEPATFRDDYSTRPAALPENRQTIANDLTRRDLKLVPPQGLGPQERAAWLDTVPQEVEITRADGTRATLVGDELVHWKYQRYLQDYLACIQGVDDGVGRILDFLDASGLAANTVVVYTSDNGFFLGEHGLYDKRFMYEPSLRVPLLVRGPQVARAGSATEQFALNIDHAPTFLELAGLDVPHYMQGRSLVPLMRGESPADWRTAFYYRYYHDPGDHDTRAHFGLRTQAHKLVHYWTKDAWELFDLTTDPDELVNLVDDPQHAELFESLRAELLREKAAVGDDDRFAHEQPPHGVDGPFETQPATKR